MGKRRWSDQQINFLRHNYKNILVKDILKLDLFKDKSYRSVLTKVHLLGVHKLSFWTKEQDDFLKESNNKLRIRDILTLPLFKNRTYYAIKNRRRLLKIEKSKLKRKSTWSKEQQQFLIENYNKMFLRDMVKLPLFANKTRPSLMERAIKLKIPCRGKDRENNPRWTGGIHKDKRGYIWLSNKLTNKHKECPYAKNGRMLEHIYVWWLHYGDSNSLLPREIIHHINGVKTDNRIENLCKMTNSEHKKIHINHSISSKNDYKRTYCARDCPYAKGRSYRLLEHTYVWWKHYGYTRPIQKGECIHHINGDKSDNRIENLQKMTSKEHALLHHTIQNPTALQPISQTLQPIPIVL